MGEQLLDTQFAESRVVKPGARPPKITQQEAAFLFLRGPYIGRLAAQEKLLAYARRITPKPGEYGPALPEYVEQELLKSAEYARNELAEFDASYEAKDSRQAGSVATDRAPTVIGKKAVKAALPLVLADESESRKDDWWMSALCAQADPEGHFPERGGSTKEAKKVCAACEVRPECLEYALGNDVRFGIWGGLSERERRKLKKQSA